MRCRVCVCIGSSKGVLYLPDPCPPVQVAALETHQAEETSDAMSLHLEALSHWHQEAEKMRQQRVDPAAAVDEVNVVALAHEQVVELLDDLVQDYLLDIRQGWIATTEY